MASTTATWYRNGVQQSGGYVGCVGYDGGPVVGRFQFTTPATGASGLSFRSSALSAAGQTGTAAPGPENFRFAITTDPDAYKGRLGPVSGDHGVTSDWSSWMGSDGTAAVSLMPSTTYYLWIYPYNDSYNLWKITGVSVSFSGAYGNKASPTAADGSFGAPVGITIAGGSTGAKYTVTTLCAGRSETLQTNGTSTYLSWTPSFSAYAALLPNAASATATITVETFYGGTSRGTSSVSITLSFRAEDAAPTVSAGWYSHAPRNESAGSGINKYIQGVSKARISFDSSKISTKHGATIAGYSVTAGGVTDSASPYDTPVLSGSTTITVKVTDSRGFSASESFTVSPLSYAAPTLSQVEIFRCDQSGDADEDGTYYSVKATAVYSGLEGANAAAILRYEKASGGSYGSGTALASGVREIVGPVNADTVYEIKLTITDSVGGSGEVTRRVPGRMWAMRFRESGQGVAFGMSPQAERRLELPPGWSIVIGNTTLNESEMQALKALLT